MSHKRNGMFSVSREWAQHLRPTGRRVFWKRERLAEKTHIREESNPTSNSGTCRCPFPRPAFSPAWLTVIVASLARAIDESRDYAALPVLADALEEAGCDNADILSYCRDPCRHIRGCWLIDLVLGRGRSRGGDIQIIRAEAGVGAYRLRD